MNILSLLIKTSPITVQRMNDETYLPIHLAVESRSPEFCKFLLLDAYPQPIGIESAAGGRLSIHDAYFGMSELKE